MDHALIDLIGVVSGILTILLGAISGGTAVWRHWRKRRSSTEQPESSNTNASSVVRRSPRQMAAELFDREADITACTRLLAHGARLVTITGPGGIGKTTLAEMTVRSGKFGEYREARLAGLLEGSLLPAWVAQEVGVTAVNDPARALERFFAKRRFLLLLDNCERLIDAAAALVKELIDHCPGLQVVATSQRELGLPGVESVLRIQGVPPQDGVELFAARARRAGHSAALTPEERALVRRFCEQVQGWPLAIELVASQVGALPMRPLLDNLDGILAIEAPGMGERQRSLNAAVSFSYSLLAPPAASLAARIAVFRSPVEYGEIREVCWDGPSRDLPGVLADLVARSWVTLADDRYTMLGPISTWLESQLGRDAEEVRERHLDHMLRLAASTTEAISGRRAGTASERTMSLELLDAKTADVWAALAHARSLSDATKERDLVLALWPYWSIRALLVAARHSIRSALDRTVPTSPEAGALLNADGEIARYQGAWTEAADSLTRSLEIRIGSGDEPGQAEALNNRGDVHLERGMVTEAERDYRRSLELRTAHHIALGSAYCRANLAYVSLLKGLAYEAQVLAGDALAGFELERYEPGEAYARIPLALAMRADAVETARQHLLRSLGVLFERGYMWNIAQALEAMAIVEMDAGQPERAAMLVAAADDLRLEIQSTRSQMWQVLLKATRGGRALYESPRAQPWRALVTSLLD